MAEEGQRRKDRLHQTTSNWKWNSSSCTHCAAGHSTTTRNEQAGAAIDAVAGTVLTNLDLSRACCFGIISNLLFVKYSQVSNGTIDVENIVVAWLLNICFFCSL